MSTRERLAADGLPAALQDEVRLRADQVMAVTGWGRSKLYAEIRAGRFPEPERDGSRCSRWRAATVLEALRARGLTGRPA